MPIDKVIQSFGSSLSRVASASKSDLDRIINELEATEKEINKSSDPITLWSSGISLASIQPESVSQLPVSDVVFLMKQASERSVNQKPKLLAAPTTQVVKKAVSFNPQVQAVSFPKEPEPVPMDICAPEKPAPAVPATPQTATKVRSMLSVWEEKIQRVTTPHYGKTPSSAAQDTNDHVSGTKRKDPEKTAGTTLTKLISIPESPAVLNSSFDGPILEIPDDLLAELEGLDPEQREKRISVLKIEADERRKSAVLQKQEAIAEPQEDPAQSTTLTGRVAAALKLFKGTTVPNRDFGIVSFAPSRAYNQKTGGQALKRLPTDIEIDGVAIDDQPASAAPMQDDHDNVKFYDAREKGVVDVEFEEDSESDEKDPEVSQLHAAEAAKEVAEEEAAKEELEKSAWLADIEEIKIVSTPAKGKAEANADWSAVSQKMNLSCHLTPVVPGRRSCIVAKPKMIPLGPKQNDEQYEITDKDTDSENELSPNSRAKKHIPSWCINWRQKAIAQIAVDPESIFGVTVPKCDLDVIFTEKNYRSMGLSRPKRVRGSSGNWTFDKLTQEEVDRYRAKLGQVVKADGVFVEQ